MKKAKKVGGGADDWINNEAFKRVENSTIKKYDEGSIENCAYKKNVRNLRMLMGRKNSNKLTKNQFYLFWIETLKNDVSI